MRIIDQVKNPFFKKVLMMLSGNGVALLLPFLLAPIISRLFSPSEIGTYELFARILAMLAIVSTLRFELALILPKDDGEALGLMKISFLVLTSLSLITGLVVFFFSDLISELSGNKGLGAIIVWLPFLLFLSGLYKVLQNFAIRKDRFALLSSNRVLASASNHGGKAFLGFSLPTAMGLTIGHFLGLIAPIIHFMGSGRVRHAMIKALQQPIKGLWKNYRDFPTINTSHALADELKNLAMFTIISVYYGEVMLGLFGLMIRYLRIPVDLLGGSLGSVFMQTASNRLNESRPIAELVRQIVVSLFLIGILPFGVIFFFGDGLFSWYFGNTWETAGKYASIISPWLFISFIVSPISSLPVLVNRQKTFFLISLAMNIAIIVAMLMVSSDGRSLEELLVWITLVHAFFLLILLSWFFKLSK